MEAVEFFNREGYCVIDDALSATDVCFLNRWLDERDEEHNALGGDASAGPAAARNPDGAIGPYSANVLLRDDAQQLDRFVQNPRLIPFVDALWGVGNSRFSQFDMRWTKGGQGPAGMQFHHDVVLESRLTRKPYGPPDYVSSIIYLTDVDEEAPAFAVVPRSFRFDPIMQAKEQLGDAYIEQPLYGRAGVAIWYDTATYHSRIDSLTGDKGRRTLHQYWARGGFLQLPPEPGETRPQTREPSPTHTAFYRIPERLAAHPDPAVRLFYSHWNTGQGEWAARSFTGDGTLGGMERTAHAT
jgi:ectoine hydroxylase-related dioxygenase (phytanoyl-CoA dioxygenase family)